MSNWGKIYCDTYWGKRSLTTLSIQNESAIACFAPADDYVDQFRERLAQDIQPLKDNGGYVEGCPVKGLQGLGMLNYYDVFASYEDRMVEDGAVVEANCLNDKLFELN